MRSSVKIGIGIGALLVLLIAFFAVSSAVSASNGTSSTPKKRTLVIWGLTAGPDSKDVEGVKDAFEKLHPDIDVQILSMGAGGMNNQKILTSIVGNAGPDLINQDRFELSDFASRHAYIPLDKYIARDIKDPDDPKASDYYPAPWAEAHFDGKIYGIPTGADDRVLYYNKAIFRKDAAKLRAAGLDPNRPPRTWSEVLAYSKVLTEFKKDGTLERAGFAPNFGNSWLYLYAFQENASFLSPDGKTCTLDTPASEDALRFMQKGYDVLGGYENEQKFESGFQGDANDPFYIGKIAMKVDGDWIQANMAQYAPSLDFATAPAPVPDDRYYHRGKFANEKDTFITWVGGFSYAIPRGAKNPEDAWAFIKFACSVKGWLVSDRAMQHWEAIKGLTYIPRQLANRVANEAQLKIFAPKDPRYIQSLKNHEDMMKFGRIRPVTMVSNKLWEEHVIAIGNALGGKMSIHQALLQGQRNVQVVLDEYWQQYSHPIIDLGIAVYASVIVVIVAAIIFIIWFKRLKIGKLDRNEAKWAYLFISPWVFGFIVFTLGPMLASLLLSFTQWDILNPARWVGLQNYFEMFGSDWPVVSKCFYNAAYLGIFGVPLGIITGLAVAILLNTAVRGMRYYRTLFYLPAIVPGVAAVVLWNWILTADPDKGLLNGFLQVTVHSWLNIPNPGWLSVEQWAKPALIVMGLWGAGSGMILWLAGLKGVPNTLYEAASLDGAGPKQQFWNVTMPMLSSIIFFNLVIGVIGAFQEFTREYILKTNDGPVGPSDSLRVPVYHLFDNAFAFFRMGYASALAWLIFAVILILTGFQFKLAPFWVHEETKE